MYLKSLTLSGFKSFSRKSELRFDAPITAIVGPNGSGKSNTADAFRFVLGEQSMKTLRSKRGEELIWGGGTGVSRANRASVQLVFDNRARVLPLDFDEVVLERSVYRDGMQEYRLNDTKVRLKDIVELLASAHIGSSSYHIISQGEADKALSASPEGRREMIEDALGLRSYQYKKAESMRKLEKTKEHHAQVESLRREAAPHLVYLKKQVKKIEKAEDLRIKLVQQYAEYLAVEDMHLVHEQAFLRSDGGNAVPKERLRACESRILQLEAILETEQEECAPEHDEKIVAIEEALTKLRAQLAEYTRSLGKTEGALELLERNTRQQAAMREAQKRAAAEGENVPPVPYERVLIFAGAMQRGIARLREGEADMHLLLQELQDVTDAFLQRARERVAVEEKLPGATVDEKELETLRKDVLHVGKDIVRVREAIATHEEARYKRQQELSQEQEASRDVEREMYTLRAERAELRASIEVLTERHRQYEADKESFAEEVREGIALIGRSVLEYKTYADEHQEEVKNMVEDRNSQHQRRRALERTKVQLETLGAVGAEEVRKEYNEARERDEFLRKELEDLQHSADSLSALLRDIEKEIEHRFQRGMALIDKQFNDFIRIMFGGGGGSAQVVRVPVRGGEDEEGEGATEGVRTGVELSVSLPKKRVHSLMMLSGGERTLTSIAFIFAMSQINPPPFLILDETDAALDEANSRRYGDMISHLSEKSQLVLITHNRETMARAGMLYGVTMAGDGVSRTISVKLEDAQQSAAR